MNVTPEMSRRRLLQMFAAMPLLPLSGVMGSSLLLSACGGSSATAATAIPSLTLSSVTFSTMPAPTLANAAAMATTTVGSVLTANLSDSSKVDFKLTY